MTAGFGAAAPDCLSLAIAFRNAPGCFPELLHGEAPLPERMGVLLRLAGGSPLEGEGVDAPPFLSADELKSAARFFIERVLLAHDADHYRVLGVASDAPLEEIKEHHRLLIRLFHPDRGGHSRDGKGAIAARINRAYNALRVPAQRAAYDEMRRQAPKAAASAHASVVRRVPTEREPLTRPLPPVVARNLPQFVLGGFALFASLAVGWVYVNRPPVGAIGTGETGLQHGAAYQARVAGREPAAFRMAQSQPQQPTEPTPPTLEPRRQAGETQSQAPAAAPQPAANKLRTALAVPANLPPAPTAVTPATPVMRPAAVAVIAPAAPAIRSVTEFAVEPPPQRAEPARAGVAPRLEMTRALNAPEVRPPVESAFASASAANPQPATSAPPPPPLARALNREDLAVLLAQLSARYERGDLEAFLALFDDGARIEGGGKARIRTDYEGLFRTSDARQLNIWDMRWVPDGESFRGEGSYQAMVVRKGETTPRIYTGAIRLEVVSANGKARLRGMFH